MAITKVLYDFNQGMALAPWQRRSHEGRRVASLSEFLGPVSQKAGGNDWECTETCRNAML